MTLIPVQRIVPRRRLLFACGQAASGPRWYGELDNVLRPVGLEICRAHSSPQAIESIERGGLAGAVLVGDDREIDGLSLLRIIRSIDAVLPCWLVTEAASRQTLEAALALRVSSVITGPAAAETIGSAVRRILDTE